jgi:hypothetical protein
MLRLEMHDLIRVGIDLKFDSVVVVVVEPSTHADKSASIGVNRAAHL